MSIKKPTRKVGTRYSEEEACEILSEVIQIRIACDQLEELAIESLMAPELTLVIDNKELQS